jgi:protein-L-isoaspartate(D-aspartate) O-methyltransferase
MVRTITSYALLSENALGRNYMDPKVMEVMGTVPRHVFLPEETGRRGWLSRLLGRDLASIAYADRPVPIGYGQTMSQPFIVALMTDLLATEPDHVVLEVGTGSGYQAAVLAHLVKRVCTIEIIPELGQSAAAALKRLGYDNVETRIGDGYYGWEDCGPFDGIVVTAAAGHIPPSLLRQLKPGGRMVIPVGSAFVIQQLTLVEKRADGRVYTRQLLPVAFVPLVRETP